MKINIGKLSITLQKNSNNSNSALEKDWYDKDYELYKRTSKNNSVFPLYKNYPCLNDRDKSAGFINNPYFPQDYYVAKKIFDKNPLKHVDIGSRIDGFVAHVAIFRKIEVFDIRPMDYQIPNIIFKQADLTNETSIPTNYCDSISCLHALEHFGLGRYGDHIDPDGHLKGFEQITRILKPGGVFYFSVPMGIQRIEFNAHRIFGMPYLINWVSKDYTISSFAYIDDSCILHKEVILDNKNTHNSFECNHGCAIFELIKK